jgi:tetratricopeptide (TPR) repeat protein
MRTAATFLLVLIAGLAGLSPVLAQESKEFKAREEINLGLEAFKQSHYDLATARFEHAVELDPENSIAHLYLATSLMEQIVPGLISPENLTLAHRAIEEYKGIIAKDPGNLVALKSIASVYFSIQDFESALQGQNAVLAVDPDDVEAHYVIGVIDWSLAHQNALHKLDAAKLTDDGMGNRKLDPKACRSLQAANSALVQDGLQHLLRAVELRPQYSDAMACLNLTYRRKADLECTDAAARSADVQQAKQWARRSMEARTAQTQQPSSP